MRAWLLVVCAALILSLSVPDLGWAQSSAASSTSTKLPPFEIKNGRIDSGLKGNGPPSIMNPAHLTSDINSPGWVAGKGGIGVTRLYWRGISTDCLPCRGLVAHFNAVMDELLLVRYEIRYAEFVEFSDAEDVRKRAARNKASVGDSTSKGKSVLVASLLEMADAFKALERELRRQEKLLAAEAQKLRRMIADCEKQCKDKVIKTSGIRLGGLPILAGTDPKTLPDFKEDFSLPFPWAGPYPEICVKCKKLATRLNQLPDWARHLQIAISSLKREFKRGELQWKAAKSMLSSDGSEMLPPEDQDTKSDLRKAEARLKAVIRNFHETLAAYNKCIKACPAGNKQAALMGPAIGGTERSRIRSACHQPEGTYEITSSVGDYRSGAFGF